MNARNVFLTDDGRLRAPWRIALFLAITVAIYLVASTLAGAAGMSVFACILVLHARYLRHM